MSWKIQIQVPDQPAAEQAIEAGTILGSSADKCSCVIDHPTVSRVHLEVVARGEGLALKNHSKHGTGLSTGVRLKESGICPLSNGMTAQLGDVEVRFIGPGSEAPALAQTGGSGARLDETTVDTPVEAAAGAADAGGAAAVADGSEETMTDEPVAEVTPAARPAAKPEPAPASPPPAREPQPEPARTHADVPATLDYEDDDPPLPGDEATMTATGGTLLNMGPTSVKADLNKLRPRLLVVNEAEGGIYPLDAEQCLIGRSSKSKVRLVSMGVSAKHAEIRYEPMHKAFYLRDLDSSNGTMHLEGPLPADQKYLLRHGAYLKLGTVEAVFMTDLDDQFRKWPADSEARTANHLVKKGLLLSTVRDEASKTAAESGRSLAEELLLSGHVTARAWCEAAAATVLSMQVADVQKGGGGAGPGKPLVIGLVVALAVALAGAIYFLS